MVHGVPCEVLHRACARKGGKQNRPRVRQARFTRVDDDGDDDGDDDDHVFMFIHALMVSR